MEAKDLIVLKGTGDGVRVALSPDVPFQEIIKALYDKIRGAGGFFQGGCRVYFTGRTLTSSDKLRLKSIMNTLLPESEIVFGEPFHPRRNFQTQEPKAVSYRELPREAYLELAREEEPEETEEEEKRGLWELPKAVQRFFGLEVSQKEDPAREEIFHTEELKEITDCSAKKTKFFEGVVRSGQILKSEGHLVIMGDVNAGGQAMAAGNIVVMGSVRGIVHAGCTGNKSAYITALELAPLQIRIADVIMRAPDREKPGKHGTEKAYLINNIICIDEYL